MSTGRRALFLIAPLLLVGCQSKHTQGGVVVKLDIDSTLQLSDLSELRIEVDPAADAGASYYKQSFIIPGQLNAFPTTLAIRSNGNPAAAAAIHLGLWSQASPIDLRDYQLVNIPVSSVTELDVTFSRQCDPGLLACGSGETCCPIPSGMAGCASSVINGAQPALACLPVDASAPDATVEGMDAAPDANDGAHSYSDVADASVSDAGDAALDVEAEAEPPPIGYDGGPSCSTVCTEGVTHCVGGTCVPVPPSCQDGGLGAGMNCGGWYGMQDCCATLDVPLTASDTFLRDYDGVNYLDMSHPATVSQFSLDVYEVTVGRFRKFVGAVMGTDGGAGWLPDAGAGKHTHLMGSQGLNTGGSPPTQFEQGWSSSWNTHLPATKAGWDVLFGICQEGDGGVAGSTYTPGTTWTASANPNYELLPITCVDWFVAYAFCIWDGGFLPSTNEWDFAAAGGRLQQVYAWGDQAPPTNDNLAVYGCIYGSDPRLVNCNGIVNIAPVGYAFEQYALDQPQHSLWGQADLTGNAYEWTLDYFPRSYPLPCTDCADIAAGTGHNIRGGGFDSTAQQLENAWPTWSGQAPAHGDVGLRCARPPYQITK